MNEIHALSGAYAVDALDDIERAMFQRHLTECSECQAEVNSLREAGAMLAELGPVAPSDEMRSRILQDIKSVRPLPPIRPQVTAPTTPTAPVVEQTGTRASRRPDRTWLRGLVAAAAVVAVVGTGGVVWNQFADSSQEQPALSAADRVIGAPDAVTVTQQLEVGGEATVVVSKSLNKMVVITKDLPALPPGTIYEMWLQDAEDGMVPAGLMTAKDAQVVLEGNVVNAIGAGITVEPAGGSRVPTSEPVALFSFESV